MLTSTLNLSAIPGAISIYARNIGVAARALVGALLAVAPARRADACPAADAALGKPAVDNISLYRLYCLASRSNSYESVSPAIVQELRLIAGRG
jgi:hypothetical protein